MLVTKIGKQQKVVMAKKVISQRPWLWGTITPTELGDQKWELQSLK